MHLRKPAILHAVARQTFVKCTVMEKAVLASKGTNHTADIFVAVAIATFLTLKVALPLVKKIL